MFEVAKASERMKASTTLLAAEFKQKSRWTYVRPEMHYGAMYLPYSISRILPFSGCHWVTRDSNRLSTFSSRYASVIADLDAEKNETELKVAPTDVRWNDHRRLYWKCSTCGEQYRRAVTSKIKFHAGCSACKKRYPSEVLKYQALGTPLDVVRPDLVPQLAGDKAENIRKFAATSKYDAKWTCASCHKVYRAPIRQRTGLVEHGQAPVFQHSPKWTQCCEDCRWAANLAPVGKRALQQLDYLGLDDTLHEIAQSANKKVPRRRAMV